MSVVEMRSYFDLMQRYLRPDSHAARCLAEAKSHQWQACKPNGTFATYGVEGAGHHMLFELPDSLCGGMGYVAEWGEYQGCGAKLSFPTGMAFRQNHSSPDYTHMPECDHQIFKRASKHLVLMRDPVDTATSALRRFWQPERYAHDRLAWELHVHERALCAMDACVSELPCDKTIWLSYELLVLFPELHVAPLSRFLGTRDNAAVSRFLSSIATTRRTIDGIQWLKHNPRGLPPLCNASSVASRHRSEQQVGTKLIWEWTHATSSYPESSLLPKVRQWTLSGKLSKIVSCRNAVKCTRALQGVWSSYIFGPRSLRNCWSPSSMPRAATTATCIASA